MQRSWYVGRWTPATRHREAPMATAPGAGRGSGLLGWLHREGGILSSPPFACWIRGCMLDVARGAALIPRLGLV